VVWLYLEVAPTGWMLAPIGLLSAGPSLQVTIAYSGVTGPRFCPEAVAARQRAHLDIVLVPYWGSKPRSGPSVGGTDAELVAKLVGWPSTYLNNKHTLLVCLLLVSGAGARRCRITACAPWFNLSWWLSNHPIQPYPLDFQGRARAWSYVLNEQSSQSASELPAASSRANYIILQATQNKQDLVFLPIRMMGVLPKDDKGDTLRTLYMQLQFKVGDLPEKEWSTSSLDMLAARHPTAPFHPSHPEMGTRDLCAASTSQMTCPAAIAPGCSTAHCSASKNRLLSEA